MSAMKIAFTADLHFERGGDSGVTQYQKSFGEMIAGMIQRGAQVAVFGGDIFNRWYSFNPRTFRIVADGLEALIQQGIQVFVLAGNHDYDISGTFPAIMPLEKLGAHVITKPSTEFVHYAIGEGKNQTVIDSAHLTFIPWVTKGMAKEAGIDLKQPTEVINENIWNHFVHPILEKAKDERGIHKSYLFFHASIFGADMGAMRCIEAVDFTLYPDRLAEYGFDRMVGGHFHRRQEHKGVHYVGSMERQNFGERDNPTGWMLINSDSYEFIELKTPLRFMEYSWDFTDPEHPYDQFVGYMNAVKKAKAPDNASVKFKYKIRRNDPFDRAAVINWFYEAGAASVVIEPEYVEEVQYRTEIKAEQDFLTQFEVWREANPDKDSDGKLLDLLERERKAGFPDEIDREFVNNIMNGGGA